ncbi:MAG: CHAP domain-containing protein [Eubacteriales bacterium]|nr:CHAP domain-containing protein [Eubacteriales bacterium]
MGKAAKRILPVLLTAAICFSAAVFYGDSTSYALGGGYLCGYNEEHTHTDDCYEDVIVCGKEEHLPLCGIKEEHLHTLECCEEQTVMICALSEHIHGSECYDADGNLICGCIEHTHEAGCYQTDYVLTCTKREHTHSASCYPKDENGNAYEIHAHTQTCYQRQLICGKEEHRHDPVLCMFASFEGIENEGVWQSMIPMDKLHGDWGENLLAVAQSQLGYVENFNNAITAEDGKTLLGYTRYGHWYGYPYGDWCAMFISWCMNYAGIPREAVPYASGVETWIETLRERDLIEDVTFYDPQPGDIVFIADNGVRPNHAAIVSSYTPVETDGSTVILDAATVGTLEVIQGNKDDMVKSIEISLPSSTVVGYVSMAKAMTAWQGIREFGLKCGPDSLIVRYGAEVEVEDGLELSSLRCFTSSDYYKAARGYAEKYLTKSGYDPNGMTIKLYEISGKVNEVLCGIPDISSVEYIEGSTTRPVIASYTISGQPIIMIAR